jgi:hypothetical protein
MIAYDRLSQIVPADQALAAKALATSLQQITGISTMTLPVLANAVINLKTTNNLDQISALTEAVPSLIEITNTKYWANIPIWNLNNFYQQNSIVTDSGIYYQAVQDVPAGTTITNTTYWKIITSTVWDPYNSYQQGTIVTNSGIYYQAIQSVPPAVSNYLSNIAGTDGKPVVICDILGIAAGYQVADNFLNTVSTFANTNIAYLTTVYQTMNRVVVPVGNVYVYGDPIAGPVIIPPGLPAAGTYYSVTANVGNVTEITSTAADSAMTGIGGDSPPTGPGLITVAQIEIGNIANNNSTQVTELNSYFNSMAVQVTQEQTLQSTAQIDFANLIADNSPTVYSLVFNLPVYGTQTEAGGMAQFWEGVANIDTFTGQAVVATLREGVNLAVLGNAGIQTNAVVPSDPVPPLTRANLIPSTYTTADAANIVTT